MVEKGPNSSTTPKPPESRTIHTRESFRRSVLKTARETAISHGVEITIFYDVEQENMPWKREGSITLNSPRRKLASEQNTPTTDQPTKKSEGEKPFDVIFDEALANLSEILDPQELQIVSLFDRGLSNDEIAREIAPDSSINMGRRMVERLRSSARKKVERFRFDPKNIDSVASYKDSSLSAAASRNILPSRRFLKYLYSHRNAIKNYNLNDKRRIKPYMKRQGYVLARTAATQDEYQLLYNTKKYRTLLRIENGRAWILKSDLERFRNKEIPVVLYTKPPTSSHKPLNYFANGDLSIYNQLWYAVKKGKISAERIGRRIFVKEDEALIYLDSSKR